MYTPTKSQYGANTNAPNDAATTAVTLLQVFLTLSALHTVVEENLTSHQLTAGLSSSSSRRRWCASNDISTSPHRRVLGRKPSPSSRLLAPRLHVVVFVAVIASSPSSASSLGLSDSLCLFRWLGGTSSSLEARATKKRKLEKHQTRLEVVTP
ncbi:hypothetical protein Ahy_B09g099120 isoform A [Arachis hypogaea]|uniref:Uncharacterized protein n=1 Tax=Arachis hypogaea TaxID=3818 RepID=A0A444XTT8_ARAHY|nr:hypothetical protein Ahy_B09g099120 isoform A [Arachis hypogaea]